MKSMMTISYYDYDRKRIIKFVHTRKGTYLKFYIWIYMPVYKQNRLKQINKIIILVLLWETTCKLWHFSQKERKQKSLHLICLLDGIQPLKKHCSVMSNILYYVCTVHKHFISVQTANIFLHRYDMCTTNK